MTAKYTGRPTTYKGIQMRSRLEAGFAAWLDQNEFTWVYEPRAFASQSGQYLPDFRVDELVVHGEPSTVYFEVKPNQTANRLWNMPVTAARMRVIHDSEPDALLCVAWPNTDCGRFPYLALVTSTGVFLLNWVCGPRWKPQLASLHTRPPWPEGYWTGASVAVP